MKKNERLYLRSAWHHFDDLRISSPTDAVSLAKNNRQYAVFMQVVLKVLCLEGDEDEIIEDEIKELFEEHKINILTNQSNA